jgi:hypothetical protein
MRGWVILIFLIGPAGALPMLCNNIWNLLLLLILLK